MNKKKGFTLIELLAVLIIIAVIGLITMPIITNTVNNSKKNACMAGASQYIKTLESRLFEEKLLGNQLTNGKYKIINGNLYTESNELVLTAEFTGVVPKSGTLVIEGLHVKKAGFHINDCSLRYRNKEVAFLGFGDEISEVETIGLVTEDLLQANDTYTYMGGTYLKGLKYDPLETFLTVMYNRHNIEKEVAQTQFFKSDGSFNLDAYEEFICIDVWGYESIQSCHDSRDGKTVFETFDGYSGIGFGIPADKFFGVKVIEENNYVWYNGFIWRILGKNADGSIRMITEDNVTSIPWGAEGTAQDYGNSYIKEWLNNYFYPRLKDTSGIVDSYFCEDSTLVTEFFSERTTCSNPVKAKAGLISIDEYNMAGSGYSYLVNTHGYGTLTPYTESYIFHTIDGGGVSYTDVTYPIGVRAVISVDPNMNITSGDGILSANADTEYVLGQTLDEVNGTLKENSGIGEYVTFDGKLYRIVENTSNGTKLILDGFYADSNGNYKKTKLGTVGDINTMFTTMQTLLTGSEILSWLAPTRSNEIINTTWYRGEYFSYGADYKSIFASNTNSFESKVGLIHVGELLSGQSLSIMTKNYSDVSSWGNTEEYWTLTSRDASSEYYVSDTGSLRAVYVQNSLYVRPVIYISSNMNIIGGNGTMSNPYNV